MDKPNNTPPPWSDAPPWARWRAQDEDGEWVWFQGKPVPGVNEAWDIGERGDFETAGRGMQNPNWRDTLQKRPEND